MRAPRSDEYKKKAVKLADTVGVTAAAKQPGIHTTQFYVTNIRDNAGRY